MKRKISVRVDERILDRAIEATRRNPSETIEQALENIAKGGKHAMRKVQED
jgi:hypothetical protein